MAKPQFPSSCIARWSIHLGSRIIVLSTRELSFSYILLGNSCSIQLKKFCNFNRGVMRPPVEIATSAIDKIEATQESINAFTHINRELVLSAAELVDQKRRNGEPLGPLGRSPSGCERCTLHARYADHLFFEHAS